MDHFSSIERHARLSFPLACGFKTMHTHRHANWSHRTRHLSVMGVFCGAEDAAEAGRQGRQGGSVRGKESRDSISKLGSKARRQQQQQEME